MIQAEKQAALASVSSFPEEKKALRRETEVEGVNPEEASPLVFLRYDIRIGREVKRK